MSRIVWTGVFFFFLFFVYSLFAGYSNIPWSASSNEIRLRARGVPANQYAAMQQYNNQGNYYGNYPGGMGRPGLYLGHKTNPYMEYYQKIGEFGARAKFYFSNRKYYKLSITFTNFSSKTKRQLIYAAIRRKYGAPLQRKKKYYYNPSCFLHFDLNKDAAEFKLDDIWYLHSDKKMQYKLGSKSFPLTGSADWNIWETTDTRIMVYKKNFSELLIFYIDKLKVDRYLQKLKRYLRQKSIRQKRYQYQNYL